MYFAVVIIMCKLKLNSITANLVPDVIAITPCIPAYYRCCQNVLHYWSEKFV